MLSSDKKSAQEAKKRAFQKSELLPYIQVEAEHAETRTVPLSLS